MKDTFGRTIDYLRISVTDRCNLRCVYCMPKEGVPYIPHERLLTYEEIVSFTRFAVSRGIRKVRLTGGEPLVRKGIFDLVRSLAAIPGIQDLAMTTNGLLLEEMAASLKEAGLHRLNVSLDTVEPHRYKRLTRGGTLDKVLKGIQAAKKAGFGTTDAPLKLNCVWMPDTSQAELDDLRTFAHQKGLELRLIHLMDLAEGTFSKVEGGEGGHCAHCNRLRLTSTGILKPCLFNNLGYDIRQMGYEKALEAALKNKPLAGTNNTIDSFRYMGG